MYKIERSEDEINDLLNKCDEHEDTGGTRWPGMSYEQGVAAAVRWLTGAWDENPMADE